EKGGAPAPVGLDGAAEDVAQSGADGDGHVEPGEDLAAFCGGVKIGKNGGGNGTVGGLANADEAARDEQSGVAGGQAGGAAGECPEDDADADQEPARESVSEEAEDGREDHVRKEEGGVEEAGHRLGNGMLGGIEGGADRVFDGSEDLAIDVVEQVDGQEYAEGEARGIPFHRAGMMAGGGDESNLGRGNSIR